MINRLTGIEVNTRSEKKNAKEKTSAIHRFFSFLFSFLHPFLILFNWAILESSDVIGGKVEIQADFLSVGKAKAQMAEAIVNRLLTLSSVVSAGWELV